MELRKMLFDWYDYTAGDAGLVDSWLDAETVAMTGLDRGWDDYWNAVLADAEHYPGCQDLCKLVWSNGVPAAAITFGWYQGTVTVSELVVAPAQRGKGLGTRIIRELVTHAAAWIDGTIDGFDAVIFPDNVASQKAFQKAGFRFDNAHEDEDGTTWNFHYKA